MNCPYKIKLGIISETEVHGEYMFVNNLYHLYIRLESIYAKQKGLNKH